MERVYISIGSNLGERAFNVEKAVRRLSEEPGVEVVRTSSFFETEPWGYSDQPSFINAAVEVMTSHPPGKLLEVMKRLEREMGRPRKPPGESAPGKRWGPRVIDLDILFFGEMVIVEEGLVIPHPEAHLRPFVLAPLAEIAPELVHPLLKESISALYEPMKDEEGRAIRRLEKV